MTAAIVLSAFAVAAVTLLAVGMRRRARARYVPAPKPQSRTSEFGPVRIIDQRVFDWETDG